MKKTMTLLAVAMAAFSMSVHAPARPARPARQRGQRTDQAAGQDVHLQRRLQEDGKPSAERQAYMSECLKKEDPQAAQQEKMKTCSADFKKTGKPGSEAPGRT
jgi:hypothetical protein